MHIGYLYVLFSLLSYSSLGILHKVAEVQKCRPLPVSMLMSAWSLVFLITTGVTLTGSSFATPASVVALAVPFGVCAGVAILALQTALGLGNISTSWLAVNLSAGLPTLLSIVLYKEEVRWWKVLALMLMTLSMVLLWKDSQSQKTQGSSTPINE
jgi:drug/metabolite transporter (DMT)-like permease